ncbi:MAG TPA: hypothetical protein VHC63_13525 [Acidimicrobiales bacterium]|nr:hypothetical protein [Acidimicrobiales bacterium]
MSQRVESAEERQARVRADAEVVLARSLSRQGLPSTCEDAVALRKIAVLIESPVRAQQRGSAVR